MSGVRQSLLLLNDRKKAEKRSSHEGEVRIGHRNRKISIVVEKTLRENALHRLLKNDWSHSPAIDAVINDTMLPPIKARGAILVNARLRVGANTPNVANATPMEPKLAKPKSNERHL